MRREMIRETIVKLTQSLSHFSPFFQLCVLFSRPNVNTQRTQNPPTFGSWGFLSSGCFQVKSAPQFSRSRYHDLDAQKIQALAVKKPCQRSASLLLCDRKL